MIQYFRDSMSNIWDPQRASRPIIKNPFLELSRSEYQAMIGVAERKEIELSAVGATKVINLVQNARPLD
jgi:hypothetical protein